ncbi:hypothetical protein, partial [Salinivibrio costicola]|uniref:hypothetical protein n=1 Tax=Salinivibrio costicola TaxID=51367 RepID=UPI000560AF9D
ERGTSHFAAGTFWPGLRRNCSHIAAMSGFILLNQAVDIGLDFRGDARGLFKFLLHTESIVKTAAFATFTGTFL